MNKEQDNDFSALKATLLGDWNIHREITDIAPMHGRATFKNLGEELFYREDLSFSAPPSGKLLSAHREYIYNIRKNHVSLYFCEGGKKSYLFMDLVPSSLENASELIGSHLCKQDLYECCMRVVRRQEFVIQYQVSGPTKDYLIHSSYTR